ncbi:hypothetical protein BX661DRAFT_198935 [Kickxella alabastrina]|uniref:uncharacterized protein n=1 Tax=Kickxella alabastrina TaxID=61397 RepID=UPI00221FF2AD|nr:uncharacterized protein BX661DRAFT_198935 [Kickxella alabastrina]KAI7826339.1 hypothetical protein BX661DRAFT_198935 [Kickxella alabastrina]
MHAAEKNTTQQQHQPPLSPGMVEPSAPQFPPPSYDIVNMGIQAEFDDNQSTSSSSHRRTPSGTGGWQVPSTLSSRQLSGGQFIYVNSLSRREFLSSLEYEKRCDGSYSSDPWINTDPIQGSYARFKDEKGTLHGARKKNRYIEKYDIHELLYDYTVAENFLKELRVDKKVIWDYDLVKRELRALIKSTGYPNNITIEFPLENDRIVVRSHRTMAKVWRHPVTMLCASSPALVWPAF